MVARTAGMKAKRLNHHAVMSKGLIIQLLRLGSSGC